MIKLGLALKDTEGDQEFEEELPPLDEPDEEVVGGEEDMDQVD